MSHHASVTYPGGPRLVADIGGTNARFALETAPGRLEKVVTLACADHLRFSDAVRCYLRQCGEQVRHAAIAIANPVGGDRIRMTNHDWEFSISATRDALGLETLLVINDFAALARAVPNLRADELQAIGGGSAQAGAMIGVVGAGTGLGVAGIIQHDGRWRTLQSEGGHVAFSPSDAREMAVLQYCWQHYDHVSAERLVSGPGIALIHAALADWQRIGAPPLDTATIVARALANTDPLCRETLECFCAMLGTMAANVAVTLCAQGGIYIGGGVAPRLGEFFAQSAFRQRFEHKGRFSAYNAKIPTLLITAPYPALAGAAAMLDEHLADQASELVAA
jgi:glucokinase